jgi:beta-xylosidase
MIFHGYENGFYNMGRQTLLEPVEWTSDGWFKTPDGIKTDEPIMGIHPAKGREKPEGTVSNVAFTLNDNFEGTELKPQWKFFGEYDTSRFHLSDNSLVIKAKGNSVGDCSPLLCIPSHHSYIAQVELNIEGDAAGGIILFYNRNAYSGILADNENILANLRGWQFPTEKKVINKHVFLRLKNIKVQLICL